MLKLCILDCETTGLDNRKCALVQLSGKVMINKEVVSTFDFKIRPFEDSEIQDEALKVNGLTLEELMSYPAPSEALVQIKEYFYQFVDHDDPKDLLIPVGYNVKFDEGFVKSLFNKLNAYNSYKNIFSHRTIDVMGMALAYLFNTGEAEKMEKFHQYNVADALGISYNKDGLHEATEDASICEKIFLDLMSRWH